MATANVRLKERAIPHFRPVLTLLVVISMVGGQLSTSWAQTKITIGYAAVSPRTTPLYIGILREVWP